MDFNLATMKILFLPNWNVPVLDEDNIAIQAPDKLVKGEPYWFFRYFPQGTKVDVLDIGPDSYLQRIEKRIKFYIKQPLMALLRRNSYDLVISHGAQSGLVYELLSSFVKRKPKHILIDVGGMNGSRTKGLSTRLIRFALRKNPNIIIHSSQQISLYKEVYPSLVPFVKFVPFGADTDYFQSKSGVVEEENYFMSFGIAKRDYKTLIDSWKLAKLPNGVKLRIVGDGSLVTDDPTIEIFDKVALHTLIEMIKRCKAVVVPLPTFNYSYGQMSFLQSMALSKMVIVTETVSSRDYLVEAPGALLVKPYDPNELSEAIKSVDMKPSEERVRLGGANLQFVKERFNEELMGRDILEFIER